MIFYIVMGSLFGIYGLDLLSLVVISAIARAHELRAALGQRKLERKQSKAADKAGKEGKEGDAKKGLEPPTPNLRALAPAGAPALPLIKAHSSVPGNTPGSGLPLPLPLHRTASCATMGPGNPSPPPRFSHDESSSGCSTPTTPLATNEPEPQSMLAPSRRIALALSDVSSSDVSSNDGRPADLQLPGFSIIQGRRGQGGMGRGQLGGRQGVEPAGPEEEGSGEHYVQVQEGQQQQQQQQGLEKGDPHPSAAAMALPDSAAAMTAPPGYTAAMELPASAAAMANPAASTLANALDLAPSAAAMAVPPRCAAAMELPHSAASMGNPLAGTLADALALAPSAAAMAHPPLPSVIVHKPSGRQLPATAAQIYHQENPVFSGHTSNDSLDKAAPTAAATGVAATAVGPNPGISSQVSGSNVSDAGSRTTDVYRPRRRSSSGSAGGSDNTPSVTPQRSGRPPRTPGSPFLPSPPTTRPSPRGGWRSSAGSSTGSLARCGASGVSIPGSVASGASTDIVIAAEISKPSAMGAWQPKDAVGGKEFAQEESLPQGDVSKDRTIEESEFEPEWPRPVEEYPLVMIQLPMYNEEAHCGLIVERSCEIAWPRSRILIQVCDDSTKAHIRDKVDAAAAACMEKGHPVQVLRRTNRQGYKAGAMVEGLEHVAPLGYKYCAIFDADFEPPKDFLLETIGPLEADPTLGFVQTRWLCPYDSFLTWAQNVNLGFHFDVEQRARSFMRWFFNFNGTAGVWRIQTISDAGGWQSDTVVEDMDLSLRAYLAGWKGIYLPHVGCPNEVPDDLSTYKTQQYRWLCGPMQILSKAFWHIWNAKHVPLRLRLNCYWFFARYVLFALITLAVLSVPPVALWLDPWVWDWPQIFLCVTVNFALAVYLYITPWSIAYLLFSVATGYFKAWAMLGGLVGSKKSKSWKVTAKKGAVVETGPASCWQGFKERLGSVHRPYALEGCLFAYYGALAGLAFGGVGLPGPSWLMGAYCGLMALIFLALSFGDSFL